MTADHREDWRSEKLAAYAKAANVAASTGHAAGVFVFDNGAFTVVSTAWDLVAAQYIGGRVDGFVSPDGDVTRAGNLYL